MVFGVGQVKFVIDDKTCLKDLLDLNLHKFEDEVKMIVDKSVKEQAMEKALKELATVWGTLSFEYDHHQRTGYKVLRISEELVEILEENQVS